MEFKIADEEKYKYPDIEEYPPLSIMDAIRAKCLECSADSCHEVRVCLDSFPHCPLIYYRFGKNPFRKKRELSEKQIAALEAGRLQKKAETISSDISLQ